MGKLVKAGREQGFTIVELMIAMLVLAIVMVALAPAFYGELKATAAANYRSTANGLAVGAIEEMRAFPFYQIGWNQGDYSTSGSTALSCVSPSNTFQTGGTAPAWNTRAGLEPVKLTGASALDNVNNNLLTSQTISPVTFTISRCVYWVSASTGSSAAYKLTWVGVSWSVGGTPWHVSQTSAIYPGGEGKYGGSGHNNNNPSAPSCSNSGSLPATPKSLAASQDPTSPTSTVDLTWSEGSETFSSVMPVEYQVNYSSNGPSGPWIPFSQSGLPSQNVDGLVASTTYWFQVFELACDGTPGAAVVVSQATATASQSCVYSNFTVSPSTASIGSNKTLIGISAFQVSVQVTSACNNIYVSYDPQLKNQPVTDSAPAGSGSLTWNTSASRWAAGTIVFTLYVGGAQTSDAAQVQISCTAKSC